MCSNWNKKHSCFIFCLSFILTVRALSGLLSSFRSKTVNARFLFTLRIYSCSKVVFKITLLRSRKCLKTFWLRLLGQILHKVLWYLEFTTYSDSLKRYYITRSKSRKNKPFKIKQIIILISIAPICGNQVGCVFFHGNYLWIGSYLRSNFTDMALRRKLS